MPTYRFRFCISERRQEIVMMDEDRVFKFFSQDQIDDLVASSTTYLADGTFVQVLDVQPALEVM